MDIKETYRQLTSIDIEEQKRIWDERGKGYYGEYLVFCELYKSLKGFGKILMNLKVPVSDTKTTEIDMVLIHETGMYVFEIKHYKGIIYGKDTDAVWTQYFRTVKNHTFNNPILQNEYHIGALSKMFPDTPIFSCIVFTNEQCDVRVKNSNPKIDICLLKHIHRVLEHSFSMSNKRYSLEEIDVIFQKLSPFSQMKEVVEIDGKEADFFAWIQPTICELERKRVEIEEVEQKLKNNTEKLKKAQKRGVAFNVIVAIICVVLAISGSTYAINTSNDIANERISEYKQKFLNVDEIDTAYNDILSSCVNVSNYSLKTGVDNAVSFTARITMSSEKYGMLLTENSTYIVRNTAGEIAEYAVFGDHLRYNRFGNMLGKGIRLYGDLAKVQFNGFKTTEDISYIKITGIELFELDAQRTVVAENLEIELYSK